MKNTKQHNYAQNLNSYRQRQHEINLSLIERSIEKLQELGANISLTSVSKISYEIAKPDKSEKGLTPAALSKNNNYSSLINKAKTETLFIATKPTSQKKLSEAEIGLEIFKQKSEIAKLQQENKILKQTLANVKTDEYPIMTNSKSDEQKEIDELNIALKGILGVLSSKKLIDINGEAHIIKLRSYGDILIDRNLFKKLRFLNDFTNCSKKDS